MGHVHNNYNYFILYKDLDVLIAIEYLIIVLHNSYERLSIPVYYIRSMVLGRCIFCQYLMYAETL